MKPTIQTHSGKFFNFLDPKPEQINIEDIVWGLSMKCRFGGHTNIFYSVAQHSVLTSELVESKYKLSALMHDAAEAYTGDVPTPLKRLLPDFKQVEKRIEEAIFTKFNLPLTLPLPVVEADSMMLKAERCRFMGKTEDATEWLFLDKVKNANIDLLAWPQQESYEYFMDTYNRLSMRS